MLAWRNSHRDQYNEMQRRLQKVYYQNKKTAKCKENLARYYFRQEAKRMRAIDLF